jgi:DNA-directed RNA polymerase specialized sigma24 family protein
VRVSDLLTRSARPAAHAFARRLASPHADHATLYSVAEGALWEAAAGFDPDKGPFRPWAMRHVKAAVLNEVRLSETLLSRHDFSARSRWRQGQPVPASQAERLTRSPRRVEMPRIDLMPSSFPAAPVADEMVLLEGAAKNASEFFAAVRVTGSDGAPRSSHAEVASWTGDSKETIRRRVRRVGERLAVTWPGGG